MREVLELEEALRKMTQDIEKLFIAKSPKEFLEAQENLKKYVRSDN